MHEWTVAGGLLETDRGLLLVRNERRNGNCDWSPPGGVIDPEDHSITAGLTREVAEETGLAVHEWHGPVYTVEALAHDLEWHMRCEVYVAVAFDGELRIDDPDGIVVDAHYVADHQLAGYLSDCAPWVREPLTEFYDERWSEPRLFRYDVHGTARDSMRVVRRAD